MNDKFTAKASQVISKTKEFAEKFGHTYIGTEHLLLALSSCEDSSSQTILKKIGLDHETICQKILEYSGKGICTSLLNSDITPRAKRIIEESYTLAVKYGSHMVGTEHLLLALLNEGESIASKIIITIGVDIKKLKDNTLSIIKGKMPPRTTSAGDRSTNVLLQYGINLTERASSGGFDPVVGRDREIERVIRILCRKTKNNPCLVGEAGVGKTAIVEGLATLIASGNAPDSLKDKSIIQIDLTSMVAGSKYRGDFEERIKHIISEAKKNKSLIIFIDEIHTIVGAGAAEGAIDASNILKPELARGEIRIIGATTYSEYKKYIERDSALERRFQPVDILEPSIPAAIEMLRGLRKSYENYHGVIIEDEALITAVELSSRFINDRFLPDKAVDVLDEACTMINSPDRDNISLNRVSPEIIRRVIGEMRGISTSILCNMGDYRIAAEKISHELAGQEQVIEGVFNRIHRAELGLVSETRPRGIFLFLGKSGVGKTALVYHLCTELYGDNATPIRFDMGEYCDPQSINRLIGAPPGYEGHSEGGELTEVVRKKPRSIILFEKIDKANTKVLNLLIQIADTGYLNDASGKRVSFKNTYIILTSSSLPGDKQTGFISSRGKGGDIRIEKLTTMFSNDLLERIDEIFVFEDIDNNSRRKIISKALEDLKSRSKAAGYEISYSDSFLKYIDSRIGNKAELDARKIIRDVERIFFETITPHILAGSLKEKQLYEIVAPEEAFDVVKSPIVEMV